MYVHIDSAVKDVPTAFIWNKMSKEYKKTEICIWKWNQVTTSVKECF